MPLYLFSASFLLPAGKRTVFSLSVLHTPCGTIGMQIRTDTAGGEGC